jgi:polygalacturonase
VIANCTKLAGHGGVVIGSEMSGGVRGVVISDCVFDGTDRGVRLKTRRGRGGIVEDLRISNIVMRNVAVPFVFNPFYFCGPEGKHPRVSDRSPLPVDEGTPGIRRVFISNVSATSVTSCAGFISGLPEMPFEDITITDVSIGFAEDPTPSVPAMAFGIDEMAAAGFYIDFVRNSRIEGVSLSGLVGDAIIGGAGVDNLTAEVATYGN